jgi:hypothetical protein
MSLVNDDKKISTYAELRDRVATEMDLFEQDPAEEFITKEEMIGYFNDAILDARSEILNIYEDYFLTWDYLAIKAGDSEIKLPRNVWANKIRAILYELGAVRYTINRIRNYNKFEKIMWGEYAQNNTPWFSYYIKNSVPGKERLVFLPTPQLTTVDPVWGPSLQFTPVKCWYLRQCNRIPILGELSFRQKALASGIFIGTDQVNMMNPEESLGLNCQAGQGVVFTADEPTNLPAEITSGKMYYLVAFTPGIWKLATTKELALAGTSISLSAVSVNAPVEYQVEATQVLIDGVIVDIPEFENFILAWVRVRVYDKLKDPGIEAATKLLEQVRKQMVDSLTNKVPDDDDEVEGDFSSYNDQAGGFFPGGGIY